MSPSPPDPIDTLKKCFGDGRLHHGIVIFGKSILQCEDSALRLVRELLSLKKTETEHPDLFHLRPSGKARIISVEKTRELISTLNRSSNQGGCKAAIIHEADRMRKEAANAFLKTLEEPPHETFIILISSRPYSLLSTIRSRCLITRLPNIENHKQEVQWDAWNLRYQEWISFLLNRENLKDDRISPLFAAYGLAASLLGLINHESNKLIKKAKLETPLLDDKEMDALETGVRKGVRSELLCKLADSTRYVVTREENKTTLPQLGLKLSRVLQRLEKISQLMEINLRDDVAIEDFYLSSLRIWTAK